MDFKQFELINLNNNSPALNLEQELVFPPSKTLIKSSLSKFFLHITLLLNKNFIIIKRNKKVTLFQLLSPVLVCLLIIFWQTIANIVTEYTEINPEISSPSKISKCISPEYSSLPCITIGYGIIVYIYIYYPYIKFIVF